MLNWAVCVVELTHIQLVEVDETVLFDVERLELHSQLDYVRLAPHRILASHLLVCDTCAAPHSFIVARGPVFP